MNDRNNLPWYYSWPAIVIAFICFWPVGIALVILRNSANKKTMFESSSNGKIYVIIGVILILAGLGSISDSFLLAVFFVAGGIALINYSKKIKKRALRYKQYIELIVNRDETSLDKIAGICNLQYEALVKELQLMIDKNVLDGAIIDPVSRTITIRKAAPMRPASYIDTAYQTEDNVPVQPVEVSCVCPGCGAKNIVVKGTTVNCEYCDSPITA